MRKWYEPVSIEREDLEKCANGIVGKRELASKYGVTEATVINHLRKAGLKAKAKRNNCEKPEKAVLEELYVEKGLYCHEIAGILGAHAVSVSRWIKQYGLKRKENTRIKSNTYRNPDGSYSVEIKSRNGVCAVAIIDAEDVDKVNKYSWNLTEKGYSETSRKKGNLRMHNLIMEHKPTLYMVCDHINHNKLDNRKKNLRIVSVSINNKNKGPNLPK